jgi:hypothetical protein
MKIKKCRMFPNGEKGKKGLRKLVLTPFRRGEIICNCLLISTWVDDTTFLPNFCADKWCKKVRKTVQYSTEKSTPSALVVKLVWLDAP